MATGSSLGPMGMSMMAILKKISGRETEPSSTNRTELVMKASGEKASTMDKELTCGRIGIATLASGLMVNAREEGSKSIKRRATLMKGCGKTTCFMVREFTLGRTGIATTASMFTTRNMALANSRKRKERATTGSGAMVKRLAKPLHFYEN